MPQSISHGIEPEPPGGEICASLAARKVLSARQIEAAERFRTAYLELAACREELGDRHYRLLASVIGQERSLREIAADQRARLTAADNLRASLDDLADLWRIAPKKRPQNGKAA